MKAGLGLSIAAALAALTGDGAAAQSAAAPAPQPQTPPASGVVGPRELRDFSLGGTPARPAETAPSTQSPETGSPAPTAALSARDDAPSATRTQRAPAAVNPTRSVAADLAPSLPSLQAPFSSPDIAGASDLPTSPSPPPLSTPAAMPVEEGGAPLWPWLLAAAALALGATFLFFRQRSRRGMAGVGTVEPSAFRPQSVPAPVAPVSQPPAPAPQAQVPAPAARSARGGIISTRLRPWIELEFVPSRCILDREQAAIGFVIKITNSGSAAAREILVETMVFNAGPEQDEEIGGFFRRPPQTAERLPALPPLKSIEISGSVAIPVDRLRILEAAGRQFFVPLVAFNALYGWGGGEGQTSRSYLVGREGKSDKMAPFRADLGPRVFRGLGAREQDVHVRR